MGHGGLENQAGIVSGDAPRNSLRGCDGKRNVEKTPMIALLDTSEDLSICESELGCKCEQLLTPLTRFKPQRPDQEFAIDNGAFANFDPNQFRSLLARECSRKQLCRFVTVPDVVGSAIRTREAFDHWYNRITGGWKLAYVAQDGQQSVNIPWEYIGAIFIGGSTEFKMGECTRQIIKAAQLMEKWVHMEVEAK